MPSSRNAMPASMNNTPLDRARRCTSVCSQTRREPIHGGSGSASMPRTVCERTEAHRLSQRCAVEAGSVLFDASRAQGSGHPVCPLLNLARSGSGVESGVARPKPMSDAPYARAAMVYGFSRHAVNPSLGARARRPWRARSRKAIHHIDPRSYRSSNLARLTWVAFRLSRDCARHGCRAQAYRDVFTACPATSEMVARSAMTKNREHRA